MTVNLKIDETSGFFKKVEVIVGVNNLDKYCRYDYKGHVELSPGKNKVGLETGQLTYFLVNVVHKFLGSQSEFKQGVLIRPKKGRKYEFDINYLDSMLDLRLYEVRKSKRREMKILTDDDCKPVK